MEGIITNEEQLRKITRKIQRLEKRVAGMKEENELRKRNGAILTEHAGRGVGLYEGKISAYEEWKDSLEEIIKEGNTANN